MQQKPGFRVLHHFEDLDGTPGDLHINTIVIFDLFVLVPLTPHAALPPARRSPVLMGHRTKQYR